MDHDLQALTAVPLIPEPLARAHHAFHPTDTPFRAAARLLASLWRGDRGFPAGAFVDEHGQRRRLGSLLTHEGGREGHSFIHPAIGRMARREVYNREAGSAWDAGRLRRNLLSSQALCFNLFGPMRLDSYFATALLCELLPGEIGEYVDLAFEHSPRRGHPELTNDYTAIDVLIRARTIRGARLLVGIEVKFTEDCFEGSARIDKRHTEIALASGAFINAANPALRQNPIQQLFRLQNLMQVMINTGMADEAVLLFVAPALNASAQEAGAAYERHLTRAKPGAVTFVSRTTESVVEAIASVGQIEYSRQLFRRYLDFHQVAGEVDVYAAELVEDALATPSAVITPAYDQAAGALAEESPPSAP